MSIIFYNEKARGWLSALREFQSHGTPLTKTMCDALRDAAEADMTNLRALQKAIAASDKKREQDRGCRGQGKKQIAKG